MQAYDYSKIFAKMGIDQATKKVDEMINLCYKLFHIEGMGESAQIRFELAKNANDYLSKYFEELNTPTIKISNKEEYDLFKKENLDFKVVSEGYNVDGVKGWKYSELGIWASNLCAMKNFLKTNYDYLMLVEDDVIISDDFFHYFNKYFYQLPEDWDIFSCFVHSNQFSKFTEETENEVVQSYQDWSTLCWLINRKSAEKIILDVLKNKISLSLDWYIFNKNKYKSYTLSPASYKLVSLNEVDSTFQLTQDRKPLL